MIREIRAASHIDHLRRRRISVQQGLLDPVAGGLVEDTHRLLQATRATRSAASRQSDAKWQIIWVAVCGRRSIGDGVCEAVDAVVRIAGAAGSVEGFVGDEAVVCGRDERLLAAVVGGAVFVLAELKGDGGHEGVAVRVDGFAGGVEGASDGGQGFGDGEKRHGVLQTESG